MKYIHAGVVISTIAIIAYFGYEFYKAYRAASGTIFQRSVAAAKGSATVLWARFVGLVGLATGGLASAADYLGDPSIGAAIQTYGKPQYIAAALVLIALVTTWARKRTL